MTSEIGGGAIYVHRVFAGLSFLLDILGLGVPCLCYFCTLLQPFIATTLYNDMNAPFLFDFSLSCIRPKHTFTITVMNAKLSTPIVCTLLHPRISVYIVVRSHPGLTVNY